MAINEKYSFKDFTGQKFNWFNPEEFNNSEIVGSSFAQEAEYNGNAGHLNASGHMDTTVDVFPAGMHGVTFIKCNLDNCKAPGGPSSIGERTSNRKIRVMNDNCDWVLDQNTNRPIEPVARRKFIKQGKSIDPENIPTERMVE